jgi:TPR repeat protein
LESSLKWIEELLYSKDGEVVLFALLALFTLWFVRNTVNYYYGEKRKFKHMQRFAREGDVEAQRYLAEKYHKGDMVKKSCAQAAFWYQKAAFSGDEEAKGFLQRFFENRQKRC